ncbi:MAG TPA: DinB family protein [Bryobacteraceae bacterium]|nr:DinB family protein [Bryobacteraceae bacterium]
MKLKCFPAVILVILSGVLQAQVSTQSDGAASSGPLSTEVRQAYQSVKKNILAAAAKVPDGDYAFKPTPEVRSLGDVFSHVVVAQMHTCPALTSDNASSMPKLATKADIQSALETSFSMCDKAYASLTDANAAELIKTPRGQRTRLGTLTGNTLHDVEQYAGLSVYMRLKGLVPPSSEKSAGR